MPSYLPAPSDQQQPKGSSSLLAVVDLRQESNGALTVCWAEAPGVGGICVGRTELARLRGLSDAVSRAEEGHRGGALLEARTQLSDALFALLDGPERALGRRLEQAEEQRRRLDIVVRARSTDRRALGRHEATWMRWELLPFAETCRCGAAPFNVVVQLGPRELAEPRVIKNGLRVLFMAFAPQDAAPELDFEREEEELLAALAPMVERRRARLRVVEEGTLEDLRKTLLVERFDVVHLSGHGVWTTEGPRLVMEDAFGGKHLVSPADLVDVFERAKAMPELVMVACCHSAEVRGSVASFAAELVAAGVPNVLGWTRPVRDDLATLAASTLYEQLGAGKTPAEAAQRARERVRRCEERAPRAVHAWPTLQLVTGSASGFRIDDTGAPLSELFVRDEVYKCLGRRMRVLKSGFVGRRRLVQRLLRILLRGQDVRTEGTRDVAGACVFGMKGVGKSCAVGRAIERAKQHTPELPVVVIHGAIDERGVIEAFHEAIATSGGDEHAEKLLARADDPAFVRVRRVMEHWRQRHVAIVLDDFEQNLERSASGPAQVISEAAALLSVLLPTCATGRPKMLITSTAEFQLPWGHERAIAFLELGPLDDVAVHKLWMRGQATNELASVSLQSWNELAERLGRNTRILTWARSLCAGKLDEELAAIAQSAVAGLPVWSPGDEASDEKHAELAALFLRHMAYEEARAMFGEPILTFVKRARVFEDPVPREAFAGLTDGLDVDLDRDLDALVSFGLLEVGELDGARAYRVSSLVEPRFNAEEPARWHAAAAAAWEALAGMTSLTATRRERIQAAWDHALQGRDVERAERLARRIDIMLHSAGLYADNLRLADRHVEALPESPFGHQWAGHAEYKAGRPLSGAVDRILRSLGLLVERFGSEEHLDVATLLHDLGSVLRAQGNLPEARQALERSLMIQIKLHGTEEHPDVAASLHELSGVLRAQGDLDCARRAQELSLAIQAKLHGTEEHRGVVASLHALGGLMSAQGDLDGAWKTLERALAIQTRCHGTDEHPEIAASLHELGGVLRKRGDLCGARSALERSLAIKAKVYGTDEHPSIAASLHELGGVLRLQGDLGGARRALERALVIAQRRHGTGAHPSVAASLYALSGIHRAQGDLRGAREALERSLAIQTSVYGTEDHPNVATTWAALALVLEEEDRMDDAVAANRRALEIRDTCFGTRDHHLSAATEVNLAMLLLRLGRLEEASDLLRHAVPVLATQAPRHPILAQLRALSRYQDA